ncbi:hypothetical protein SARC_08251 [Sphaeroforma arctica JP610]|uniref:Uncharacterized protein n=1 Tax=Sphaeroforma arctica JP610 TaxID=667725 RepID=A0A0L0FRP3_9EUKA|nr:hypothetical protein SARC_08251 [Sphaeroforma arctica JP610]KNC79359.1 hypothetical protein SARC_08251 [Sphaeroforma arctica JP610]|eukprot:XP_014153261.1 hypothetical protein SARC_08251 [Sphaeroforma arctica JP610]
MTLATAMFSKLEDCLVLHTPKPFMKLSVAIFQSASSVQISRLGRSFNGKYNLLNFFTGSPGTSILDLVTLCAEWRIPDRNERVPGTENDAHCITSRKRYEAVLAFGGCTTNV